MRPRTFSRCRPPCSAKRRLFILLLERALWSRATTGNSNQLKRARSRVQKRADMRAVVAVVVAGGGSLSLSFLIFSSAFSTPLQTFLILVATADLRALLYTRCFSARRCLWSAFCLANTTTEPRAAGADAVLEEVSTAVPLTDDVDARDGFLRAGAGVDTARPEKALASMMCGGEGEGTRGKEN